MTDSSGAPSGTGSREPDPQAVPALPGFDPSLGFTALAERVEAAAEPDRELDCHIYAAVFIPAERAGRIDISAPYVGWHPIDGPYVSAIVAPRYTASLDAAIELVPEGVGGMLDMQQITRPAKSGAWARVQVVRRGGFTYGEEGHAATLPIAICAAALRARSAGITPNTEVEVG